MMMLSPATAAASDGEAGQADEFLRYGANVRSLGLGRAYVSLADDASALYLNPAGLVRLTRGFSVYSLYFKPFHESDLNFVSFAVNRPDPNATGWFRKALFGPKAAWGGSFVHLGSDGYEQRDDDDNLIDEDFGLYQYAFMLGFAREETGSAGILGYGATIKYIRHGVSNATGELDNSDGSWGFDIGAQFQMINPPLLKKLTRVPLVGPFFKLKHLMPLRLGLGIRNVKSPKLGYGGEDDKYPTALRFGASYRLPSDWFIQNSRILQVSDAEWLYNDMDRLIHLDRRVEVHNIAPSDGQYFGTELQIRKSNLQFSPRFGMNHVFDEWKISAGFGLALEWRDFDFRCDFAHGFHENLDGDERISLSIRFGGRRDAVYFDGGPTETYLPPKDNLLQVLSDYPDNRHLVRPARDTLANTLDTLNRMRYLEMFFDMSLADYWYLRARQELEKGNPDLANLYTNNAIDVYKGIRKDSSVVFSDSDVLNNAESYAIAAITESDEGDARRNWERVAELAAGLGGDSLRAAYLMGLGARTTGGLSVAIERFETALSTTGKDSRSMRLLSRYELAGCLMESGQPDSSLKVLKSFFDNPNSTADSLADHYPRFPAYTDRRLSDDALYMVAEYYRSQGPNRAREALLSFGNVCRFYPDLDKCRDSDIEKHINELIKQLSE